MRSRLLVAYDAECHVCRKKADWLRGRDREGLIEVFPLQHPDLAAIAPELAGRFLHGELHGLDLATRRVFRGPALLPELLSRLPGWKLAAPLLRLPGLARFAAWFVLRRDERRFRRAMR
jgi:predicted DCC family thiol-disulfide oxidoreductase YuxK